jgi:hypothetical protein
LTKEEKLIKIESRSRRHSPVTNGCYQLLPPLAVSLLTRVGHIHTLLGPFLPLTGKAHFLGLTSVFDESRSRLQNYGKGGDSDEKTNGS